MLHMLIIMGFEFTTTIIVSSEISYSLTSAPSFFKAYGKTPGPPP